MTPNPVKRMSLEEYFEFDKNAEGNFEYFNGEVLEMSGVSVEHSSIELNLALLIAPRARELGCQAFSANFRVKPASVLTYRYPDLTVACGKAEFVDISGLQCLANPVLIVEVLSDSTEQYDRGGKFREYKSIETFQEYLLVSSTTVSVTLIQKRDERFWFHSDYVAGETFHLNTLDLDIAVEDLYQGLDLISLRPRP